jgi:D-methionine transport system ATP-binding protein
LNAPVSLTPEADAVDVPCDADRAAVARLVGVSRHFGAVKALDGVSIAVRQGEVLGLIGRSGAGKSTLIRCLNGLERPDAGTVEIEGVDISRLDERRLQPVRRPIGMIFQHFNLLSAKTVADNIALPLKIEGRPRAARRERVAELLDLIGLSDKANAHPAQLSGGQKQRVGIARALAAGPALLLSDEATSALDPETTQAILALLKDINRRFGLTILLITHEMGVVRAIADRVAVLDGGRIVEQGPVWRVFAEPRAQATRSLLHSLQPALPDELRAALRADGGARAVLKVKVVGDQARQPLLAELALATGVSARLLHGGVDHVQREPVGTLFLEAPGHDRRLLGRAVDFLRQRTSDVEVLGYVADDA